MTYRNYCFTSYKEFNGEPLHETIGKYSDGQIIPSSGKTPNEVILESFNIPSKDKNIIGATKVIADYLILEIPDLPEVYKNNTVFIYIPSTKRYGICEKAPENKDSFVTLKIEPQSEWKGKVTPSYIEPHYTTTRAEDILNLILLHRLEDKKLSDNAFMWIEEIIMAEDAVFSEVIDRLVKEGPIEDKDFDILGIDAHAVRGTRHGLKYNI